MAELRLDLGRGERFSASARSTGGFDRLLPTRRDLPLPKTPGGAILAPQLPGIRGMSDKTLSCTAGEGIRKGGNHEIYQPSHRTWTDGGACGAGKRAIAEPQRPFVGHRLDDRD